MPQNVMRYERFVYTRVLVGFEVRKSIFREAFVYSRALETQMLEILEISKTDSGADLNPHGCAAASVGQGSLLTLLHDDNTLTPRFDSYGGV